jgi:hypothetical protein
MALQKKVTVTDNFGINVDFDTAYIKVSKVMGGKDELIAYVDLYDQQGGNIVQNNQYIFQPSVADDSDNFIKQSYEYIKTLDKFLGATDC